MPYRMEHSTNGLTGMIIAGIAWIVMKFFLFIGNLSLAEYSSICVILGVAWTFIANADKVINNITRFNEWIKTKRKK
jgi:hypothetical protein